MKELTKETGLQLKHIISNGMPNAGTYGHVKLLPHVNKWLGKFEEIKKSNIDKTYVTKFEESCFEIYDISDVLYINMTNVRTVLEIRELHTDIRNKVAKSD